MDINTSISVSEERNQMYIYDELQIGAGVNVDKMQDHL